MKGSEKMPISKLGHKIPIDLDERGDPMKFQKAKRITNTEREWFQTLGINAWISLPLEVARFEKMQSRKDLGEVMDGRVSVSSEIGGSVSVEDDHTNSSVRDRVRWMSAWITDRPP